MKTLKSKLLMLTLLFMGIVAVSFALTNKEKPEAKIEKKVATTWNYVGTANPGVFSDENNWEQGTSTNPNCGTDGDIPCELIAEAADKEELADHLEGMSNSAVLAISNSKRF